MARDPRNGGFTLLEVLLVIVLLVTAFFPIIQVFMNGMLVNQEIKATNTAVELAQKKLEEKEDMAFTNISSESVASFPGYSNFTGEVIVTTPKTNMKDVLVRIYWRMEKGATKIVSEETIITNY